MKRSNYLSDSYEDKIKRNYLKLKWHAVHLDPVLLLGVLLLAVTGLFILYSASNENMHMVAAQASRLGIGLVLMVFLAQIHPQRYKQLAPWIYAVALLLLFFVLFVGKIGMGAQRWLNLGIIRFQPSELMKIALPLMLANYLSDKPLPPSMAVLVRCLAIILVPSLLTIIQPDLGTGVIILLSGAIIIFLAGMSWRIISAVIGAGLLGLPVLWHFMHHYQKERVLTFLNPERDPLGSGYHIIQSKIAIGSGGILGKGWLNGTQSHLNFLPAHSTDFIFAVYGEELGLIGCILLLTIFLIILARCVYISYNAHLTFNRLLVGGLGFIFILSAFINIGMVIGILPVVGVPLPLISYGGTSSVTFMIGFGIIMSAYTHKSLLPS